jgi:hypothetical protein
VEKNSIHGLHLFVFKVPSPANELHLSVLIQVQASDLFTLFDLFSFTLDELDAL